MPATSGRLEALRRLMQEHQLAAYYVPSEDAHQSEYIASWDGRREFLSGFTGSAGFALVTAQEAALWTDGRYYLQAEKQLDSNWTLMKAGLPGTPSKEDYLLKKLTAGECVGVDAHTISYEAARRMRETLEKSKIGLKLMKVNLVDQIWSERPPMELKPIFLHPTRYSGREAREKLDSLRKYLQENQFHAFVVTALDEVAWLFNLRGSDINCNPNFFSYALIMATGEASLYLDDSKLESEARAYVQSAGVKIKSYHQIFDDLSVLRRSFVTSGEVNGNAAADSSHDGRTSNNFLLISGTCNAALVECVGAELITCKASPVAAEKAIKNEVELAGFRACHIRDAAALVRYFAWLEEQLAQGVHLDEVDGAKRLEEFRAEGEHFRGLSFDTISGSGPNGAIIHYKPEKPYAAPISENALYLCDSGGQYLDGTTDVTRTVHFGRPSSEEKEAYTRVLLGHIALDQAIFPTGTSGFMLDSLARLPLWAAGLDYRHGTGHGVGHFLNVHEGPHSISFHIRAHEVPLRPGMTVTNEPGVYLDGHFGVRIENVLIVTEVETRNNFGGVRFLGFENITMVPMCRRLLDMDLLTPRDVKWLDAHHKRCWDLVSPLLAEKDPRALQWLCRETAPLSVEG